MENDSQEKNSFRNMPTALLVSAAYDIRTKSAFLKFYEPESKNIRAVSPEDSY